MLKLAFLYFLGVTGQLLVDLETLGNVGVENFTTHTNIFQNGPAQPTKIVSDGKLCDANVTQHSGYVKFDGVLGEKSYFFWLLESRSNPSTDPLVCILISVQLWNFKDDGS